MPGSRHVSLTIRISQKHSQGKSSEQFSKEQHPEHSRDHSVLPRKLTVPKVFILPKSVLPTDQDNLSKQLSWYLSPLMESDTLPSYFTFQTLLRLLLQRGWLQKVTRITHAIKSTIPAVTKDRSM